MIETPIVELTRNAMRSTRSCAGAELASTHAIAAKASQSHLLPPLRLRNGLWLEPWQSTQLVFKGR